MSFSLNENRQMGERCFNTKRVAWRRVVDRFRGVLCKRGDQLSGGSFKHLQSIENIEKINMFDKLCEFRFFHQNRALPTLS